jgi:hypothetical protein
MPRRAGRTGAARGSAFTNTIASVVTITIVKTVKNVSTETLSTERERCRRTTNVELRT